MEDNTPHNQDPRVISYLTLRKAVGILGISLPVIVVVGSVIFGGCEGIQSSISNYYHTNMRNIFVGILCAIALFLFAYKGYDKRDAFAGTMACIFALGVAFFPTSLPEPLLPCMPYPFENQIISSIHFISAGGFFLVIAYFSIFLFTIKDENPTRMKLKRNKLYRICSYIILGAILLIAIYAICLRFNSCHGIQRYNPIFWLETIALWAFGISWLTKGKAILVDK
ncbi:MAG: hypothetical protein AMS27_01055 [Bacteroides sp. SM23_62_1]|nr:MAG: hypothetical protein AMS27_01055 [Bacteroides sp. SM23_62_1]